MYAQTKLQKSRNLLNQETGTDFYQPGENVVDDSFSYEIEMQKQYVIRLKNQRQKIEALYTKYDVILSEIKKKDCLLKEKDDRIVHLTTKTKNLQLTCQQYSLLKEENKELINENLSLKHRVVNLESQNSEMLEQMKLKDCLLSDQREQLDNINDLLQSKVKSLNAKLLKQEEDFRLNLNNDKQKHQRIKNDQISEIGNLNNQIGIYREESIKKDQMIHMLRLDHQFLSQKLKDNEENYTHYLKQLENKIQKNQKEKKIQIKSLKEVIEQKNQQLQTLGLRVSSFKQEIIARESELADSKQIFSEQKRLFDEDVHLLKSQISQDKNYYRQQLMQCQNHIDKLEGKLNESLKRESNLVEKFKKFEINEAAKRNLRDIERQEMDKINHILNMH